MAELSQYGQPAEVDEEPTAVGTAQSQDRRKKFAVVCISASDQADDLTAQMLAQLMEQTGHPTLLLSAVSLSNEVLRCWQMSRRL